MQESGYKVLVVEDDEFSRDFLEETLISEDYEVVCATNGMEAMKCLEQHKDIAVILLDRMMPKMSGIDVLSEIEQDDKFSHIPVIMQTARSDVSDVIETARFDIFYYLSKPFEHSKLVAVVQKAIESINKK